MSLRLGALALLALLGSLTLTAAHACPLHAQDREDCGYAGIGQSACESRGCCWLPLDQNSAGPWCFKAAQQLSTCALDSEERVDCGYSGIDESGCEAKGCCWSPLGSNSNAPWCFYTFEGYSLHSYDKNPSGGISGTLSVNTANSVYGDDIANLYVDVVYEDSDYIHIRITDADAKRWEVPQDVLSRPTDAQKDASPKYDFSFEQDPFTFSVTRKADNAVLFDSRPTLVFKDQYIQLSTSIDANTYTYGLGESTQSSMKLSQGTYTLWSRDSASAGFNSNLYGAHPFYLQLKDGNAHGVFLLNSNGMDITLGDDEIVYKLIGGVIDLYVFVGPTPSEVVKQYQKIIGTPMMQPYWSLGFHNCKYGYTSIYEIEDVVTKYAEAGIPLDTQWSDIDYMEAYKDFTLDPTNFPQEEFQRFVDELHANGQHFVPIIDPGIMVADSYDAYTKGVQMDVFVKDISGGYYLGQVWPGPTYFPDFLHPSIEEYWTGQLQSFYTKLEYDGLWIDMNEVSNFCNTDGKGQVCANKGGCPTSEQTSCCLTCTTVDSTNLYDFPPYNINNGYGLLSTKTMAMSSVHANNISEYDAHNLYGLGEAIATNAALVTVRGKRPFLLSRSTFASAGKHTAHWTGDNAATWSDLRASIVTMLNFALFGVSMVGADICGFLGDTTEELCARWIEVGAFYPFSRDHNTLGAAPQELYLWDSVAEASRNALGMKYKLLPYIYTMMYRATRDGEMLARPLFAEFPDDTATYDITAQFLLGPGLLVSPVVTQGELSVSAYFPRGLWYSFSDLTKVDASQGGTSVTLSTPLTSTNVHMRGGVVFPTQQGGMTTTEARATPFTLHVPLDSDNTAKGDLFLDDGEQIEITESTYITYSATSSSLVATVETNTYAGASDLVLGRVVVVGVQSPSSAALNGAELVSSQISYDSATSSVAFSDLELSMSMSFTLTWG